MSEGEASVNAMIAGWLTPSCLFILLNLVIGTIAITSHFACRKRKQQLDSSAPSPSLLDRVTSFGLGCCKHQPGATTVLETEQSVVDSVQTNDLIRVDRALSSCEIESPRADQDQDTDDLTRIQLPPAPSLMERIVSLNFRRSDSVKSEKGPGPKPEGLMEDEKCVDARADVFIKSFKQQLRMQRLDSILRYRNMLQRN